MCVCASSVCVCVCVHVCAFFHVLYTSSLETGPVVTWWHAWIRVSITLTFIIYTKLITQRAKRWHLNNGVCQNEFSDLIVDVWIISMHVDIIKELLTSDLISIKNAVLALTLVGDSNQHHYKC